MARLCLDTQILILDFNRHKPLTGKSEKDAQEWARSLIDQYQAPWSVSPVEVEFLCGISNEHERRLREAYFAQFQIADGHSTTPVDWQEARRIAKHAGHEPKPRDLGDCLILAIAKRLRLSIETRDVGMTRQSGRTRQQRP